MLRRLRQWSKIVTVQQRESWTPTGVFAVTAPRRSLYDLDQ